MKKFRDFNTYFKLLILIIGTSVLFFLLYVALYIYTTKQENNLYKTTQNQYYNEVTSIIQLHSKTPISTIIDVTFWDELKNFTESKDEKWYNTYVASQFETYEVDYIGAYTVEGQFIIKTANSKIKTKDFIPKEVMIRLYQSKLMRFYMKIPEGVVEVFGATIHPSNDPKKNKTKPSGYFFMARLLDQSYFKNIGNISSSDIKLVALNSASNVEVDALEAVVKLKDYKRLMWQI